MTNMTQKIPQLAHRKGFSRYNMLHFLNEPDLVLAC